MSYCFLHAETVFWAGLTLTSAQNRSFLDEKFGEYMHSLLDVDDQVSRASCASLGSGNEALHELKLILSEGFRLARLAHET